MCSFFQKVFCPLISKWLSELIAVHRQFRCRCQSLVRRQELGFEMGLDEQHGIRFLLQSSFGKVSLCRADYSDVCGFAARIQDTKMLRIGSIHIYIEQISCCLYYMVRPLVDYCSNTLTGGSSDPNRSDLIRSTSVCPSNIAAADSTDSL